MQSGHKRASRSRRRSRCHSRMLALRDWSRHSCCSLPNMPLRCHCREPLSLGANTMPKLPSAINILAYAASSYLAGGMARASLDDDEVGEDDFQTLHTPVHRIFRGFWGRSHLVFICPGGHQ